MNNRGERCFQLACAAMGLAPDPLAISFVSLTRGQRDLFHELWRVAMIADASEAGEWPVSAESIAATKAIRSDYRNEHGHGAPGHRGSAQ